MKKGYVVTPARKKLIFTDAKSVVGYSMMVMKYIVNTIAKVIVNIIINNVNQMKWIIYDTKRKREEKKVLP
jgi:hypothetical protein